MLKKDDWMHHRAWTSCTALCFLCLAFANATGAETKITKQPASQTAITLKQPIQGELDLRRFVPQGGVLVNTDGSPSDAQPNSAEAGKEVAPDIYITIEVPEDAKIFVNGDPTAYEGKTRYFVVRHLEVGKKYKFVIAAETKNAAGVPLEEVQTLELNPGARERLSFSPYKKKKSADSKAAEDKPEETTSTEEE